MNGVSLSRWIDKAAGAACIAAVALLAAPLSAAETDQLPYRSGASRYAAKQVRLPEEKPQRIAGEVRQATHVEHGAHTVRPVRTARRAPAYRTQNLRSTVGDHSVIVQEGEVIMDSAMMPEPLPAPGGETIFEDGHTMHHPGVVHGGAPHGHGGGCNDCGSCGTCNTCCLLPCPNLSFDNFEFFAGADAFNGPLNRGAGGSFGFHEGVNWGSSLPCTDAISIQIGGQAIQSSFSGNDITDDDRRQFFGTAGVFRRVDAGLQGGIVADFLHDEWYYEPLDLAQVRGEVSWVFPCQHELGVWFTQNINNGTAIARLQTTPTTTVAITEGWQSTDIYAAFYRRHFDGCNGHGRVFAGFTENSDGIVGADVNVPIAENWAVRSEFTYLIPAEGHGQAGNIEEAWNVSVGIVWYPGCRTARSKDYNRPLFNVANNGTFFVDHE